MVERELKIINSMGLHAKPVVLLVKTAGKFESTKICILFKNMEADAKSPLGLLSLTAGRGSTIVIRADGPEESQALQAIIELFAQGFGEE